MAALNVIANIQPSFVISDAAFAAKRLPPALLLYSYCWYIHPSSVKIMIVGT
ncbi:hypothetical protein H257_05124 [Aphanomyces astaci]|uniref:Uncharacterized protein n=1 Tax=Aphanomyces astaci TaxID=112090 RepID=W4GUD0_APHAT|nr:hypothetical protein H257_05124 [Aphanomyces astaci]ETV82518.1 hypothetical protein H257_05124 [Aphanomyces astaci]|eukprot:XP_009828187.1 hypothetical protein H257_05124 [Aphanomyces astaci]